MKKYNSNFKESLITILPEGKDNFVKSIFLFEENKISYNIGACNNSESFLNDYKACLYIFDDFDSIKDILKDVKYDIKN
jgi:hypothetical protein